MSHWQQIALALGSDKAGQSTHMPLYERLLGPRAPEPLTLLEMGVLEGHSMTMWQTLFPNGRIIGMDYNDRGYWHPRVSLYWRYQQDPGIVHLFEHESLDIIIDDASHNRDHQRASVDILWPCLKQGGLYFIEDVLTDAFPDELNHWRADPHCLLVEANLRNIHGGYERSDAVVVLKKPTSGMPRLTHPLAGDPVLRDPRWPGFFHHMEQQPHRPYMEARGIADPRWGWSGWGGWLPYWLEFTQ